MQSYDPIPVAVLGATGYAGEGAIRILLRHPGFTVVHAGSDRLAGTSLGEAVPALVHESDLILAPDTPDAIRAAGAKAIVLAKKSVEVTAIVPELLAAGIRVVDIGAEFRLHSQDLYDRYYKGGHQCPELLPKAIYGLCECWREQIKDANLVGNPGCYPTSILLPLIPLLRAGHLDLSAPLSAICFSGASGAGKRFLEGNNNLYYALNENMHSYKALAHQHTGEIDQELSAAAGKPVHLHFVPHLAALTRGILSSITARLSAGVDRAAIVDCWQLAYGNAPFVRLRANTQAVEVANVASSNYCDFACEVEGDFLFISSAEDNLVKGAAGQAVQNLNLMFGYPEDLGLRCLTV
jgi:N-acetyl-gamma-glutamyl-phosphate reductase